MRSYLVLGLLVMALQIAPLRRALGEDRLDFKYMYYQEDDDRMAVQSPAVLYEADLSDTLTIKLEGIYNAISGATPTGLYSAPKVDSPAASAPVSPSSSSSSSSNDGGAQRYDDRNDDDDDEREDDDRRARISTVNLTRVAPNYAHYSGASSNPAPDPAPAPTPDPAPSSNSNSGNNSSSSSNNNSPAAPAPEPAPAAAPDSTPSQASRKAETTEVEDERWAFNVDVTKKLGNHSVGGMLSVSTEGDYQSLGLAARDAVDFNQKNTTLLYGGAYTYDRVDVPHLGSTEDKQTLDAMVGLTQVLTPQTLFTVNLTLSQVSGYMADPYKLVSLNGEAVPEVRPDDKDKQVLFLAINHMFPELEGSLEASYRFYEDSFGIQANTIELAWYQKLGADFVLRPMLRWYEQSEADFYGTYFEGSPDAYSSDYRVSALRAMGYGIRLIWTPSPTWSMDIGYERYEQEGTDGVTPSDAYPSANVITAGARWWL